MNIHLTKLARPGRFLSVGVLMMVSMWGNYAPQAPSGDPPPFGPIIVEPLKSDLSPALRDITPIPPRPVELRILPLRLLPRGEERQSPRPGLTANDPLLQSQAVNTSMPSPTQNFEGVSNVDGVLPPDTQGDVGPNHYVQWVNLSFAIWNKSGTLLYGPASGNTLWSGFGGPCQSTNDGDPITQYDSLADRWLMSQFALPTYPDGPFYQCIAVSQTGDPTGSWYRYAYEWPGNKMNDYPKFGVWPDGYYMSVNQFASGTGNWAGAGVAVFERSQMVSGLAARMVSFDLYPVSGRTQLLR
jgi:hypothetical protein